MGERTGMRAYTSFEGEPGEGVVEVFLEAFGGQRRLLVGSGGPVAEMLATLGGHLGLTVQTERALGAAAFAERLAGLGAGDAVVFVDHDAPGLLDAVRRALAGKAAYIGVMGSRRHTPGFVAELRDGGADLRRLHSPTGLDIGARVPPEIALSILSEVLAATRGRAGGSLDIVNTPTG
jgi:xanthine dehydrogenase accessory factor